MNVNTLWYAGRGTGLVALLLLTLAVVGGIAARSGRPALGLPRFAVSILHRNVSLMAICFVGVHVFTLLFDRYAHLNWWDLFVPFVAHVNVFWYGLGTIGFDLMLAVVVTSLLRHRIGVRTWRLVHWSAYVAWPVGVAHTLGSGTDAGSGWLLAFTVVCVVAVVGAVFWRGALDFEEFSETGAAVDDWDRRG
jgi:sulfoxide reductase heme-binding subunit YedZ